MVHAVDQPGEGSVLKEHDDKGACFTLDRATSYCAEDAYTRLARDVVIFTPGHKFLVRKWGGGGHRAQASHGNAFGTFFYRPPKNIPAREGDIKFAVPMWDAQAKGWLLTFAIDGLGPKNRELAAMFGEEPKQAMLHQALVSEVKCYVMPSASQSDKSSIAAPMTALVSFLQHDECSLDAFPDFAWASIEQAIDPSFNVHAGVVASYCLEKRIMTGEVLKRFWADDALPVRVELPERLSTLQGWGDDVISIYASMKGLLLEERHLHESIPEPLPQRTCEPRK